MKLNSFKESKGFTLDDEQKYYGILTDISEFTNPHKQSQGGLVFKFDILNSHPLAGDGEGTSKGKELKLSFWANGKDDDGEWTFPASGKYRSCLDALCKFKDVTADDIESPDDIYGAVVRFMIENEEKEVKKDGKSYTATYSNIMDTSIKPVPSEKVEATKKAVKAYLETKGDEGDDDIEDKPKNKPKTISKKEAEKSIKKHVEKEEEDDDEFGDDNDEKEEKKEVKKDKKEEKKTKKEEKKSDEDDDFFDD